jgi:hypothetical protein
MFSSPNVLNVMELASVLQSLFNVQGQPKVIRVAPVPSLSTVIVQGRPEDLRRVEDMVLQLESRARALEQEAKPRARKGS